MRHGLCVGRWNHNRCSTHPGCCGGLRSPDSVCRWLRRRGVWAGRHTPELECRPERSQGRWGDRLRWPGLARGRLPQCQKPVSWRPGVRGRLDGWPNNGGGPPYCTESKQVCRKQNTGAILLVSTTTNRATRGGPRAYGCRGVTGGPLLYANPGDAVGRGRHNWRWGTTGCGAPRALLGALRAVVAVRSAGLVARLRGPVGSTRPPVAGLRG